MMPAQKPETLIQSQQVIITGPVGKVKNLLNRLSLHASFDGVTVTLTPTSVPDATVGVTQDSQQNPRQSGGAEADAPICPKCGAAYVWNHNVDAFEHDDPCFAMKQKSRQTLQEIYEQVTNGRLCYFGDHTGYTTQFSSAQTERWRAVLDAQGSVTEQSQQKSRQDGEA